MNILFVCTGNTCRSPMAAAIMNKLAVEKNLDVRIESAGLAAFDGEEASANAVKALDKVGINLSGHRSQTVTEELLESSDIVLTMTNAQKKALEAVKSEGVYTVMEYAGLKGDISDPYGGDVGVYLACAVQLYDALTRIAERIEGDD